MKENRRYWMQIEVDVDDLKLAVAGDERLAREIPIPEAAKSTDEEAKPEASQVDTDTTEPAANDTVNPHKLAVDRLSQADDFYADRYQDRSSRDARAVHDLAQSRHRPRLCYSQPRIFFHCGCLSRPDSIRMNDVMFIFFCRRDKFVLSGSRLSVLLYLPVRDRFLFAV